MKSLKLGLKSLTLEEVHEVAVLGRKVELAPPAIKRIEAAHKYLLAKVKSGDTFYGINTGFGLMSNVKIKSSDLEALQYNLIRSHACGVGPYLEDRYVRAMLLLRAANLTQGHSGVSVKLVRQILDVLNAGVCPLIPEQGSVGASGDLAPLAHLALVLIGEGKARLGGEIMSGAQALQTAGLQAIRLGPKEGLALINGTQFMTAIGALTLLEAEHLCDAADAAAAMTLEALRGTDAAFSEEIHAVRPHPGQIKTAQRMRKLLTEKGPRGGKKSAIALSHADCGKVQDPYSLRCVPQVHGASRDTLTFVRQVLSREINAVTDNPLIFPKAGKGGKILSGGNFHGQIVAMSMDYLSIAAAEIASISELRIEKLINPALSDLPAFLVKEGGLNSGYMIIQVAAAAIVSENKTLCHPASVDSIPTSADKEDHVSMGAWAARKAAKVVTNTRRVLSMELMAGAQGIDLLRPLKSTQAVETLHAAVRERVPFAESDRIFHDDILAIECWLSGVESERIVKV